MLNSKIDDSNIVENIEEAEKLLYDEELDLVTRKIEINLKQNQRIDNKDFIENNNYFVLNLLKKFETINAKFIIYKMIHILKLVYSKEKLILNFNKTTKLENDVEIQYPLFNLI